MKEKLLFEIDDYIRKQKDKFDYIERETSWNPHAEKQNKDNFYSLLLLKMIYDKLCELDKVNKHEE